MERYPDQRGRAGVVAGQDTFFTISNQEVLVLDTGGAWWNAATFGADQEAFFTFTNVGPNLGEQALPLKLNGNSPAARNASQIEAAYDAPSGSVLVWTYDPGNEWVLHGAFGATFGPGDGFGARAQADGTVSVWRYDTADATWNIVGSTNVKTGTPWPAALINGGGQIGAWFQADAPYDFTAPNDARFDDFGGG